MKNAPSTAHANNLSGSESHTVMSDSCDPVDCTRQTPPSIRSPGKNTGVGSHFLLQGIFPTQVSCNAGRFFTI